MLTETQKAAIANAEERILAIIETLEKEHRLFVADIDLYDSSVEITACPAE